MTIPQWTKQAWGWFDLTLTVIGTIYSLFLAVAFAAASLDMVTAPHVSYWFLSVTMFYLAFSFVATRNDLHTKG